MKHEREREEVLTLGILEAIDTHSDVTQRHLAAELGVALGLANSYLKRCVRKGLVKIHQAPANRYLYYLTPQGFAEKSRLTAEYLASSFDYYNRAGLSVTRALRQIEVDGHTRVLFTGVSELAEIARVKTYDFEFTIVGTFDMDASAARFIGRPVWRRLSDAAAFDAVLYTQISVAGQNYVALSAIREAGGLYLPDILEPRLDTLRN